MPNFIILFVVVVIVVIIVDLIVVFVVMKESRDQSFTIQHSQSLMAYNSLN